MKYTKGIKKGPENLEETNLTIDLSFKGLLITSEKLKKEIQYYHCGYEKGVPFFLEGIY